MSENRTTVRIGRLVVETGRNADAREVARSIEAELRRLAGASGDNGRPHGGGRIEAASSSLELPAGTPAREIGNSVARSIWAAGRQAGGRKENA